MSLRLSADWLTLSDLQHLFMLFETAGATLRLVGGSVRDGLLGLPVQDIDLAVDRAPEWGLELLKSQGIQAIPTGIEHGTITAILDHRPYQITTLRVDVKTFGRRAEVAFTEDWAQDAQRRDFTINAIYADKDGTLFDPVGGLADLQTHTVRFIGDPDQRIQEDYLRILRFFRFSARFGQEPYDAAGLTACAHFASHLPTLARERITEEVLKILALPSPLFVLQAMQKTGVLNFILHPSSWETLPALTTLEQKSDLTPNPLIRIAALAPDMVTLSSHLRLSKAQARTLAFLTQGHPPVTLASLKKNAYQWGQEATFALALLQAAQGVARQDLSVEEGSRFLIALQQTPYAVPSFPLSGEDVLAHGVPAGPQVGQSLTKVETWWLDQGLTPDRKACLAHLATLV